MIKVNLLRDTGSRVSADGKYLSEELERAPFPVKEVLTKGIAFLLPVVIYLSYRGYREIVLSSQLKGLSQELTSTQEKLKSLDPAVKEMDRFQVEKSRLDSQLDVIKRLSKERLKNVKSLDALEGIIPQRAWLKSLKFTDNKVEFSGLATDDLVVSEFMSALEASIYFANVTLVSSEELKVQAGNLKAFIVRCVLENL
jgi:Tfp pilus assembly protein PilN